MTLQEKAKKIWDDHYSCIPDPDDLGGSGLAVMEFEDFVNVVNDYECKLQKLHDHYQSQIGEWEERLKVAEDWINKKCLKKDIERYYLNIKHQTPDPK